MSASNVPTPADVRAFAVKNDLPAGGARGRLPQATIDAFNKGRKNVYVPGAPRPAKIKVSGVRTNARGRKTPVTMNATHGEVRAAAEAAGVSLGARGRIPSPVLSAFASGTLSELAATQTPVTA